MEQHAVLERSAEAKQIDELQLCKGAVVQIVWRAGETLDREVGEWTTTVATITGVVPGETARFLTAFELDETEHEGTLPLEYPFEMASIKRIKAKGVSISELLASKRPKRERESPATPFDPREFSQAQIDAQRGRSTIEVPGGEGLRIPASVAALWLPLYPNFWIEREASPSQAEAEWRKGLATLQAYLGASFKNSAKRDDHHTAVENTVAMVYRAAPKSRMEWRTMFSNTITVITDIFCVVHGARAAELLEKKCRAAFTARYVDFELLIRDAENATEASNTTPQEKPTTTPQDAQIRALQCQLAAYQNAIAQQPPPGMPPARPQHFRGGRGRGRGPY